MKTPHAALEIGEHVRIAREVSDALAQGRPVVALETAVVTHGLPRAPLGIEPPCPQWNAAADTHLEVARQMTRIVREGGAVPALTGVIDGVLIVGIQEDELRRLASAQPVHKASAAALAALMAQRACAGTTVSATLAACLSAGEQPIRVFATGGIGGVHRDWIHHPDVSADLGALAHSPVCVVCSGAKSILDLPATREMLEALCVPVIGYRTDHFPMFHHAGSTSTKVTARVDDAQEAARLCSMHFGALHRKQAVLLCQPVPAEAALPADDTNRLVDAAWEEAQRASIRGADVTPFLLDHVARSSDGASLRANLALLLNNARLAAEVAVAMK